MKQVIQNPLSRRKALAGAGVATAAAAAAVVLPGQVAPTTPSPAESTAQADPQGAGGYRLTEHIKRYYDTARA